MCPLIQRQTLDLRQLQQAIDLRHQRCALRRIAPLLHVSLSSVGRAMNALGLGRLSNLDPKTPLAALPAAASGAHDLCRHRVAGFCVAVTAVDAANAMLLADVRDEKIRKGWFENTLPYASFPCGIAVLRMDADWYESTYQILESLFPFVNQDGLLIIDDYHTWDGCSKAVHDYLSRHKRPERINSHSGVCFIRKVE